MRGISEERLKEIAEGFARQNREYECVTRSIISECRELNPWMTLDEFLRSGFIGACWIYTSTGFVYTSYYAKDWQFYESDFTECRLDRNTISRVIPLHKPEPPR